MTVQKSLNGNLLLWLYIYLHGWTLRLYKFEVDVCRDPYDLYRTLFDTSPGAEGKKEVTLHLKYSTFQV